MKVVVSPLPPLTDQVRIRARVQSDLPALQKVLVAQQPESGYPLRDPLTFPLDVFLHAGDAVKAWTAELAGEPVGHVCRAGPARKSREADLIADLCAQAYNCDVRDLAWVNSLFVAASARRLGIGRRLMSTVVDDSLEAGLHPCLELLPTHPGALSLYLATGWKVVERLRPEWLREIAGEEGPDVHIMILASQQNVDPSNNCD